MTSFRTYQTVMEEQASKETKTITSTMTSLGNDWLSRPYSEQTSAKNSWLNYSGTDKLPSTALSIGTPMEDSSSPSMINSTVTSLGNDWLSGPHSRHSSDKIGYFGTDKLYSTASSMGVPIVASSNPSIMCPQPVRPSFGQNLSHGLLPPIYEKPELSFAGGSTPTRFMPPLLRPISEKPELTLDGVSTEATNAFMPPLLRSISEKPELTFDGGSTANTKTPMLPLPRPISVKQELTFDGGSTPSTEAFMPPLPIQLNKSITKKSTKESVRYPFPGMPTVLPTGTYMPRPQPNYNSMPPVTCTYPDRGCPGSGMVGFQYMFQHSMASTGSSTAVAHAIALTQQTQRRPRSEKKPIPEDLKDAKYFERRKRNNMAAKKSRDARKSREDEIAIRASFLEKENAILRAQVATLREEANSLRQLLLQKRSR